MNSGTGTLVVHVVDDLNRSALTASAADTHCEATQTCRFTCHTATMPVMLRTGLCRLSAIACLCLALSTHPSPASAQQRPVATEDPNPISQGTMLLEAGIDHTWAQRFPVSGLEGNLLRGPLLGLSSSLGPSAELQVDGLSWSRLAIRERFDAPLAHVVTSAGDSTSSVDDIVIGTKVRLASETPARPAIGLRFATRLPNAGNEKGIGTDTMDFFQSLLVGKTVQSVRLVGNVGIGILSDATRGDHQNDVLTYGFSLVRSFSRMAIVGDVNGWVSTRAGTPPPGTESRGTATLGFRYPLGRIRLDGGVFTALSASDTRSGITGGMTWIFDSPLGP